MVKGGPTDTGRLMSLKMKRLIWAGEIHFAIGYWVVSFRK